MEPVSESASTLGFLSIDGGGVRGIIPLVVLKAIEKQIGALSESFQSIAGASVGSFIACSLAAPDANGKPLYSAAQMNDIFDKSVSEVFSNSVCHWFTSANGLARPKYDAKGLESVCQKYLNEIPFSSALSEVYIPSASLANEGDFYFSSHCFKRKNSPILMREVVRCATAAPYYFPSYSAEVNGHEMGFADGGTFDNNPCMSGFLNFRNHAGHRKNIVVLSIGTGNPAYSIDYKKSVDWGLVKWAPQLINLMFKAENNKTERQMRQMIGSDLSAHSQYKYLRLDIEIDPAHDNLDDKSPGNIKYLKQKGKEIVEQNQDSIETFCRIIKK